MYDEGHETPDAINAIPKDEREGLMQSYVQVDRQLEDAQAKHSKLSEELDMLATRKRDLRNQIAEALGLNNDSMNVMAKAAR